MLPSTKPLIARWFDLGREATCFEPQCKIVLEKGERVLFLTDKVVVVCGNCARGYDKVYEIKGDPPITWG